MFFKKKQATPENNFEDFPRIGGLMISKMVFDQNIKPRFMYREKRTRPEDSGWRIFTGFESEEYTDDPNNTGIYNPSTLLKLDPSMADLLLKGVGSVFEKDENNEWYEVIDFELEDDYITTNRLTEKWQISINNLFERKVEESGDLLYTTGDKSVRLTIFNRPDKNKEELLEEYQETAKNRDQSLAETLKIFDFSENYVARTGYLIKETDGVKAYSVIYGFSIIAGEVLMAAFYFDNDRDFDWAVETWKHIGLVK